MPNSQYIATLLEGKMMSKGGSRKIKATKTSLDSILAAAKKIAETATEKAESFVEKLKAKNVLLHKIGEEVGKANFTGRKAINVSSGMRENEKRYEQSIAQEELSEVSFASKTEEVADNSTAEKNDPTNADTIINALQIFENTHDLGTEDKEDTEEQTPAYMQVSGEIKSEEPEVTEESSNNVEQEEPQFEMPKAVEEDQKPMPASHESSGYLDGIKAFKQQIGTDKYEDPVRNFNVHTNANPIMQASVEQPMRDFTVHTNTDMKKVDPKMTENNSDIDDFVKGYYNLDDLSLSKIRSYKTGCEEYVQQARASKTQAGQEINNIDDQIDAKNAQINELYAQIKILENDKDELNHNKQDWQNVYSKANTEESLGASKIDEINQFVYQQFNSINQMDNNTGYNSYSAPSFESTESTGYGRGRAA